MRNAFVVLVSFCIGLASGFIVPSGSQELVDDNHAILADNNGKHSEEANSATLQQDTGFIVLPFRTHNRNKIDLETNRNRIKDKELYEQETTKHTNNVNERSFIYINQKFKTPVVNQLYSSHDLVKESYKSLITHDDEDSNKFQSKFNNLNPNYSIPNTKKEYFETNIDNLESKNFYLPPSRYYQETKVLNTVNNRKASSNRQTHKGPEEQRDYIELLKPPLLRPESKHDIKENRLWRVQGIPFMSNDASHRDSRLQVPNLPLESQQYAMKYYDNFGFATPYGYQRSIPQFKYIPEEVGMATDGNVKKALQENSYIEGNKVLDQDLKESLEDQVTNERMNEKSLNCNYSSCILKSTKQYLRSRVKEPECKCRGRLNILKQRQSNGFEDKGTNTGNSLERTDSTADSDIIMIVTPSENSDYGDILAEEMNLKKLIEE